MGVFKFFSRKPNGVIGYFGLSEWWISEFSEKEKKYIIQKFQPMGFDGKSYLIKDTVLRTDQTCVHFLYNLAGWFNSKNDRDIAYKILGKAEEFIDNSTSIMDAHFFYATKVKTYYNDRDNIPGAFEKAIEACKSQINVAPKVKSAFQRKYKGEPLPSHTGFEQLAIIQEKQKQYEAAIETSKIALKQGWNGDWEKRIERCKKKL